MVIGWRKREGKGPPFGKRWKVQSCDKPIPRASMEPILAFVVAGNAARRIVARMASAIRCCSVVKFIFQRAFRHGEVILVAEIVMRSQASVCGMPSPKIHNNH